MSLQPQSSGRVRSSPAAAAPSVGQAKDFATACDKANDGQRIAVIENEFGEAGVDNEILVNDTEEQIVEMNNGCICCSVRGDLVRILGELKGKRDDGRLKFDRVVIETTGMADPGPVAQTFFLDEGIGNYYLLDSIITVVDAKHFLGQLEQGTAAVGEAEVDPQKCNSDPNAVSGRVDRAADPLLAVGQLLARGHQARVRQAELGAVDLGDGDDCDGAGSREGDRLGDRLVECDPACIRP